MRLRRGFAERGGIWTMAIALSIGLHVGGLLLLSCCNSGQKPSEPETDKPLAKESVQESVPEAAPEKAPAEDEKVKIHPEPEPEIRFDLPPEQSKPSAYRKRPSQRPLVTDEKKPIAEKKPAVEKSVTTESKKPEVGKEPEPKPDEPDPVKTTIYVVKKGDTLTSVAKDHKCTVSTLARLNKTTAKKLANLRFGQQLKVPKTPAN